MMKKSIISISMLAVISLLMLTMCPSPWQGDGGTLSVSIGSGGRAVLGTDLAHTITVTDSSGKPQTVILLPGVKTTSFSSLAFGTCGINVKGWLSNDPDKPPKVEGSTSVEIKPGNNTATINLAIVDLFANFAPGLYEGTPEELLAVETATLINDVSINNVIEAFDYINYSFGYYTLLINESVTVDTQMLKYTSADRHLTIIGIGGERTIQYNGPTNSSLFVIEEGTHLTLGNNITLKGISKGETWLVGKAEDGSGTLTMLEGSKITGHTNSSRWSKSGAVNVSFYNMEGGEISGNRNDSNSPNSPGGFFGSNIIMSGGTINGNYNILEKNKDILSDVFVDVASPYGGEPTGSITLSGNAYIGSLILHALQYQIDNNDYRIINATITIEGGKYNGSINGAKTTINLYTDIYAETIDGVFAINTVISRWEGKQVIRAGGNLDPSVINKFQLGNFCVTYGNENNSNYIEIPIEGYRISNSGVLEKE